MKTMDANEFQSVQLGYTGSSVVDVNLLQPTDSFVGGLPVWLHPDPPSESLTRFDSLNRALKSRDQLTVILMMQMPVLQRYPQAPSSGLAHFVC